MTEKAVKGKQPALLDVVALLTAIPEQGLARGQVGTVVRQESTPAKVAGIIGILGRLQSAQVFSRAIAQNEVGPLRMQASPYPSSLTAGAE